MANLRPEVKKIVQALQKMEACTMPEAREMLRAVLNATMGGVQWDASLHLQGKEKFQLHWYEDSTTKS